MEDEKRSPVIIGVDKEKIEKIKKKYNPNMSDQTASKIRRLEITNKVLVAAAALCGVLTAVDFIIPDPIPLLDEAVLTGITTLLGTASGIVKRNIDGLISEEKSEFTMQDVNVLANQLKSIKKAREEAKQGPAMQR